jgi:hypothetical protein
MGAARTRLVIEPRRHLGAAVCPGPAGTDLVKRVIALPGQTIYSADGILYVDGRRLREPYLPPHDPLGPPIPGATRQDPLHVIKSQRTPPPRAGKPQVTDPRTLKSMVLPTGPLACHQRHRGQCCKTTSSAPPATCATMIT